MPIAWLSTVAKKRTGDRPIKAAQSVATGVPCGVYTLQPLLTVLAMSVWIKGKHNTCPWLVCEYCVEWQLGFWQTVAPWKEWGNCHLMTAVITDDTLSVECIVLSKAKWSLSPITKNVWDSLCLLFLWAAGWILALTSLRARWLS